ncbi:MAG TPA: hypothetical protein VFY10_03505 [Dehalococcoidia bacterium]|nr:hypothetical protein [Dehalococcoidia bacterium]
MEWGILFVLVLLLFTGYVIVQETRAQLHWRSLVEGGDVDAIRQLVEGEIDGWHRQRVPGGTPALIWHGIQTAELLDVNSKAVHVSCNADGEFALVEGKRVETSSPLNEGMKITKKLAEMLLYDVPNVKLDQAQIDVYTSFRNQGGEAETQCILSTTIVRRTVEHIDWEETEPTDFVTLNQGRFGNGRGLEPIDPIAWPDEATRSS